MSDQRSYTEKEAAKILRIASEIQQKESEGALSGDGVSIDDLARIGEEVGLDANAIRLAANRIDDDGDEAQVKLLGAPASYELERMVDGPLDDALWDAMVGQLNSHFTQSVAGVVTGKTRTWNWKHDLGGVHFTAHQTGQKVRLTLKMNIDDGISVGMIPSIAVMLGLLGAPWSMVDLRPWGAVLLGLALAGAFGFLFRKVVSNWYQKDRKKNNRLMDKLTLAAIEAHETPLEMAVPITAEETEVLEQRLEAT